MQYLTKKEYTRLDGLWKRTFLEDAKKATGKYSKAGTGCSDWVILAEIKNNVWLNASAVARYDAQVVPEELYLWTDTWYARLFREKPSLDKLWIFLNEGADAVYATCLSTNICWTFILAHEEFPCQYIYSEKSSDEDAEPPA